MAYTALVVHLRIAPTHYARFVDIARAHGARSMQLEEGCLDFEVLECEEQPNTVILVEKYRDAEALETHWNSAHMAGYLERVDGMIAERQRFRCTAAG